MGTNFWELLHQRLDLLIRSGHAVADYLLQHADEAQYLSISCLLYTSPRTFQQAASGENAAADAGPQRDTDDVRVALRAADPDFTQRHAVGVVGDSGRQTELCFQLRFNGASDVVGQAAAGPGHDALSGVDLSCGRNADARKALRSNSLLLEELFGSRQHRGEDGRLVVVEADALLLSLIHI